MRLLKSVRNRTSAVIVWLSLSASVFLGIACSETGTRVTESGSVITTGGGIPDLIRARNERKRGPVPESTWNKYGMWKKIGSQPPTYIPSAYSRSAPRTDEDGQWFLDVREEADGKRFFVPNYMEGQTSSTILAVEAEANVNWQYSKGKNWYHKVDHRE